MTTKVELSKFGFRKSLAKFYHQWFRDCMDSAKYCESKGKEDLAIEYLERAQKYFDIINSNWDAIEFFSVDDRAYLIDSALPKEFQNYD